MALVIGLIVYAQFSGQFDRDRRQSPSVVEADSGKSSAPIVYQNTRSDVKYVGDAACAACHPTQAESYRHHPMGRSLAPISDIAAQERYEKETHNPFEQLGFQFLVKKDREKVIHRQALRDAKGKILIERDDPIHYVLGSGSQGKAYLYERDGYLFESPISWYSQKQIWDLSPGFDESLLGGRSITATCLFCHCNRARPIKDTQNHYQRPIFEGYAIGCERCHGPGELHVAKQERAQAAEGPDDTIVNPAKLPPALREAVCQQCHLIGASRRLPKDRRVFDYRPGLPLHEYWAVFVSPPLRAGNSQAVGQVEQMYLSRCFRGSNRQLGCISCHDPHSLPPEKEKASYYRDKCIRCHEQQGCTAPESDRRKTSPRDNCIQCHMPRFPSSDIAHTAATDHRIRRWPVKSVLEAKSLGAGEMPIVNFYQEFMNPKDPKTSRELGVALVDLVQKNQDGGRHTAELALPYLEESTKETSQDVAALLARANALWLLDRRKEAGAALDRALVLAPNSETVLFTVGFSASAVDDLDSASDFWKRAQAINPWEPSYHAHLAQQLSKHQDWPRAIAECQAALRLNPADADTHRYLLLCWMRTGEIDQARRELDIAIALNPDQTDQLRQWFEQLSKERKKQKPEAQVPK
jgi:Flp pilus assembly protein TadD